MINNYYNVLIVSCYWKHIYQYGSRITMCLYADAVFCNPLTACMQGRMYIDQDKECL